MLENLLEKLEDLFYLAVIETIERHYRVFCDHIAEGDKGLVFFHVKEQESCNI